MLLRCHLWQHRAAHPEARLGRAALPGAARKGQRGAPATAAQTAPQPPTSRAAPRLLILLRRLRLLLTRSSRLGYASAQFIRFHKLPSFLANKLHAYAEFQFAVNRGFKVSEIAEAMPLNLQAPRRRPNDRLRLLLLHLLLLLLPHLLHLHLHHRHRRRHLPHDAATS